jgi:hypothetical protein
MPIIFIPFYTLFSSCERILNLIDQNKIIEEIVCLGIDRTTLLRYMKR